VGGSNHGLVGICLQQCQHRHLIGLVGEAEVRCGTVLVSFNVLDGGGKMQLFEGVADFVKDIPIRSKSGRWGGVAG
jgi:hypothetical protein